MRFLREDGMSRWIAAVMVACGWLSAWFLVLRPPSFDGGGAGRGSVEITYLPVCSAGGKVKDGLHAVWSPVLFSLPTPVGFSRYSSAPSVNRGPPMGAARAVALFLKAPLWKAGDLAQIGRAAGVVEGMKEWARRLPVVSGSPFSELYGARPADERRSPMTRRSVGVKFAGGIRPEEARAAEVPQCGLDRDWEVRLQLGVGADGVVEEVFVMRADASGETLDAVVRAAWRWRFAEGEAQRRVRAVVRCVGGGESPVRAEEE